MASDRYRDFFKLFFVGSLLIFILSASVGKIIIEPIEELKIISNRKKIKPIMSLNNSLRYWIFLKVWIITTMKYLFLSIKFLPWITRAAFVSLPLFIDPNWRNDYRVCWRAKNIIGQYKIKPVMRIKMIHLVIEHFK